MDFEEIKQHFRDFLAKHDHFYDGILEVNSVSKFDRTDCRLGKPGNDDVSYFIRTDDKDNAYGFAQCHSGSCEFKQPWRNTNTVTDFKKLSPKERKTRLKEQYETQRERISDRLRQEEKAAQKAAAEWHAATYSGVNQLPYVIQKCFDPAGLKKWGDTLIIPLSDTRGNLHNIEYIYTNGDKRPISGARVNGIFYLYGVVYR